MSVFYRRGDIYMANYEGMSLADLKSIAKERGLKNISTMRKQELIDVLNSVERKQEELKKKVTAKKAEETKADVKKSSTKKKNESKTEEKNITGKKTEGNTEKKTTENKTTEKKNVNKKIVDKKPVENKKTEKRTNITSEEKNKSESKNNDVKNQEVKNQEVNNHENKKADNNHNSKQDEISDSKKQLDSGETKEGILEVLPDGYGFIRCDNYLPGENDVYVSPAQIRKFNLKTGDIVIGNTKIKSQNEKFSALLYVKSVNGFTPLDAQRRPKFEDLTPIFPNQKIRLECGQTTKAGIAMRMVDLISPIGKGQRGMIVSPPKAGKTTLLKQVAKSITKNHPDMKLIILLIDERPEEVTDIKESIEGENVEVIYSTFDELPENHKRVSEMVIERAKRLVEHKQDVCVLLDSITRLARAYNLTVQPSGRTLSGGLDPAALHMPKRFFGAARNMREGGSLTILSTALVETGSRMDDVVFEEFKGTGNMELVLDRSLSEKRIFPAIDLARSSTRRDDLLLNQREQEAAFLMHRALTGLKSDEAVERIIDLFIRTRNNEEFIEIIKKTKIV